MNKTIAISQHVTEYMQNLPALDLAKRGKYTKAGKVRKYGYVATLFNKEGEVICDIFTFSKKKSHQLAIEHKI